MDGENFTGSAVYNIRYLASLCIPVEKTQIICKIENINNAIILATHGPISSVITPDNINTLIFVNEVGKYYYMEDKQRIELKKGDLIKLTILSKKLYKNDIMISLGFLDEIALQSEKDNFYKPELFNPDQEVEELVELIEFHEDEQIEEENINKSVSNQFII